MPPPPSDVDPWSPTAYHTNASFVFSSAFTTPVLSLLSPLLAHERILDLGCGSGELTLLILSSGVQSVVGADKSPELLQQARRAGEGKDALTWVRVDGHELAEARLGTFDAVFSNAALHWMKEDPKKVVRGVAGVLKNGGRFVGEFGGYLNMVGVRGALHSVLKKRGYDPLALDPWYFPTVEEYSKVLESEGFRVDSCELVPRITKLPTGLEGWLNTFGFAFLNHLSPEERKEVIEEVCEMCEVDFKTRDGGWEVMYVRLRFKGFKI